MHQERVLRQSVKVVIIESTCREGFLTVIMPSIMIIRLKDKVLQVLPQVSKFSKSKSRQGTLQRRRMWQSARKL